MHLLAPHHTVHVIGQATPPLYFNCSIELDGSLDALYWFKYDTLNDIDLFGIAVERYNQPIQLVPGLESEYDVERSNLIVKDADFDDAGTYHCRNQLPPLSRKYADAIVLGKFVGGICRVIILAPPWYACLIDISFTMLIPKYFGIIGSRHK